MSPHVPSSQHMRAAIDEAIRHAEAGRGGPFAALVVKDDRVIATGFNAVTSLNDPTAHAEMQAIRAACASVGTFRLADCEIYATCEPCPMCLGGIYWARLRAVYYAASRDDAAAAGFDDSFIYDQLSRPPDLRSLPLVRTLAAEGLRPFQAWMKKADRVPY